RRPSYLSLPLHDALPIFLKSAGNCFNAYWITSAFFTRVSSKSEPATKSKYGAGSDLEETRVKKADVIQYANESAFLQYLHKAHLDRKSTRLNSSHVSNSY